MAHNNGNDVMNCETENPSRASSIDRVSVKVPPFIPTDSELWFIMLEGSFKAAGVTQDSTKYGHSTLSPPSTKDYKPPPQLNKKSNMIQQEYKISTLNVSHDKLPDSILSSSTTNICDVEFSCTDVNENNQNSNVITLNEIPVVIASNSKYTPPAVEIEESIRPNGEVTSTIQKPVSSNTYNKVQRILRECTLIKMYVKSIDIRLKCLENGQNKKDFDGEEVQIIQDQLPIKTIDQLIHFDQSMEDENVKKAFIMYVKRIGGANRTDNVKAIFKRIFTNQLGTKCSWLGQRNNFKICDLSITVINNSN